MRITNHFSSYWPTSLNSVIPANPIVRIALAALAAAAALGTVLYFRRTPAVTQLPLPTPPVPKQELATTPSEPAAKPAAPTPPSDSVEDIVRELGLVELNCACAADWILLSFDEILATDLQRLERVITSPIKNDLLCKMLISKTEALPAKEILQKCPLLFRRGYFLWNTQQNRNSPTFRDRFEAEVKSAEDIKALATIYGPDFSALRLFSPAFLERLISPKPAIDLLDIFDPPPCCKEWAELSLAQILTSHKDKLEEFINAATPLNPHLRHLLLSKADAMPAVEILKQCPLLFQKGIFDFRTKPNGPLTFRQRFEREIKTYEQILELKTSYCDGILNLGLLSQEFVERSILRYAYNNPGAYLGNNQPKLTSKHPQVKALASSYFNKIYDLRIACSQRQQNQDAETQKSLQDELEKNELAIIADFKADLGLILKKFNLI